MTWLAILGLVLLVCFAAVVAVGAPYLPTLKPQLGAALDLAGLRPGQTLLELGCGDGRVMVAAAKRGYQVVGYELNPLLVAVCWLRTRRYRRQVRVVWGDFWRADWPPAAAVFTFLLPRYMGKLDDKLAAYPHRPVRLVSFAFEIKGRRPAASKGGVFVYDYK